LLDALNSWQLVSELKTVLGLPAAASFKHVSPAGAAVAVPLTDIEREIYDLGNMNVPLSDVALAYVRARNSDPMCSFGDFAAFSHTVDLSAALLLKNEVCDGIIAPGFDIAALEILKQKKKGSFVVLLVDENFSPPPLEFREVFGACFAQRRNNLLFTNEQLENVSNL
jgi:phosphoribosylaminoimidazolecarboxamide formyltransferase / IMP cyclohydrolase